MQIIKRLLSEPLKKRLRALHLLIAPMPEKSAPIPQELLENCKVLSSRYDMLDRLPKNAVCCEVGTLKGDFAKK